MLLVDKEFRITDDVDEKDMRDLDLNFLFNLGRHSVKLRENKAIDNSPSADGPDQSKLSSSRPLLAIGNRKSKIANIVVPVVQRIERRFPKAKTAFLQEFADVVRSAQTAVSEYLE